jgi:HSP20 family protein
MEEEIPLPAPVFKNPEPSELIADVYETAGGDAYVIEIPVPGLRPDEIVLEVDPYSITVRTDPQQAAANSGRNYIQREQSILPRSRLFDFPVEIDTDNVQANLENGILRIRVPKASAGKRKVIRIGQAA